MKMSNGSVMSEINDSEVNIRLAKRACPPRTVWMIAYIAKVAKGANVTGILAKKHGRQLLAFQGGLQDVHNTICQISMTRNFCETCNSTWRKLETQA